MNIQLRAAGKCNNFGGNVPGGEVTGGEGLDTVPIYFYYHLTAGGCVVGVLRAWLFYPHVDHAIVSGHLFKGSQS